MSEHKDIEEMTFEEKQRWVAQTIHLGLLDRGSDGLQSAACQVVMVLLRDGHNRGLERARTIVHQQCQDLSNPPEARRALQHVPDLIEKAKT